jgi:hypothetical protein
MSREVETNVIYFDKQEKKIISGKNNQTINENKVNNKQTISKHKTNDNLKTNIQKLTDSQIINKLFNLIDKKILFIEKNTKTMSSLKEQKLVMLKSLSENALENDNVLMMKEILRELDLYKKRINVANNGRKFIPKFDKKKHLQDNKVIVKLLQNKKFLKQASENNYKRFSELTKNVPSSIVRAINEKNITQSNGNPHSIESLTYIANIIREQKENENLNYQYLQKYVFIAFAIVVLLIGFITLPKFFNTHKKVTNKTEFSQTFDFDKIIIDYEKRFTPIRSDWRRGVIMENLNKRNFKSETEILYFIDSINKKNKW